ncbi:MAG: peptide chain release factor N(5)-glutamine methyltransferase [Fibrobacter sp.]|nr:peptide chain release factor N(5)-glutamine methyltransferase [Fibrobacter sp.]
MAAPANNGPMTVLEILNRTKIFFEKKGVPDALLDAQYIISHGLKMKNRMDIYLNFEKPLTPAELDVLREMVARRANREPLQHIIGDTSFRGFIIKCDRRALIPRPETESLVDMAIERLKNVEAPFIVEIGTGSGCISIATAKEIANSKVIACDISEEALSLAKENASANELAAPQLAFAKGDLLNAVTAEALTASGLAADQKIDCLIANLPYIPDSEKGKLQPEVDKFDPALALYGGPDGLDLVRSLLQQTQGRLNAGAPILLEIGSEQAAILKDEAVNYPWLEFAGIHKDYNDNIRFVSYKAK